MCIQKLLSITFLIPWLIKKPSKFDLQKTLDFCNLPCYREFENLKSISWRLLHELSSDCWRQLQGRGVEEEEEETSAMAIVAFSSQPSSSTLFTLSRQLHTSSIRFSRISARFSSRQWLNSRFATTNRYLVCSISAPDISFSTWFPGFYLVVCPKLKWDSHFWMEGVLISVDVTVLHSSIPNWESHLVIYYYPY